MHWHRPWVPNKAEKGQRNLFGPTLGLSLTTYAYFAIIEGFFSTEISTSSNFGIYSLLFYNVA